MPPDRPLKVVILHDYLTQSGGAERVVATLLERWPQADLRTLVYDPNGTFAEFRPHAPRTSFLQPIAARVSHRALLPLLPLATRSLAVEDADVVISSSSGWAHGVPVAPGIPHLCYCHNPPRWIYDRERYVASAAQRLALAPLLAVLRRWDQAAARRPTRYVANSHNVRRRIMDAYGRSADVVHPPVDVHRFHPTPARPDGYLLVLSRLLAYKRVDLAIAAAQRVGMPLVIAGEGPERRRLEALAGPGVTFAGRVEDAALPELFAGAAAFFLGGEEDFGITPLEATAAGRPVVAYGRGGALETVHDGETGVLFDAQSPEAAAAALGRALSMPWDPERLARHAAGFGATRFLDEIEALVDAELDVAQPRAGSSTTTGSAAGTATAVPVRASFSGAPTGERTGR